MTATIPIVVTDQNTGLTARRNVKVTVTGEQPTLSAGGDATIKNRTVFHRLVSFSVPAYETPSATVDYGDGTGVHSLKLGKGTFTLRNRYTKTGRYTVTVTLSDQFGDRSSTHFTVTVK
jgi:hypothetical protein